VHLQHARNREGFRTGDGCRVWGLLDVTLSDTLGCDAAKMALEIPTRKTRIFKNGNVLLTYRPAR
jgi:hypothetical protein